MSLNQLVSQSKKKWMDVKVGGFTVDGSLNYDNANKSIGDSLVLDSNKIARWVPVSRFTSSSVFTGRLATVNLSAAVTTFDIASASPFPADYSIISGNKVQVNKNGVYLIISNLYSTGSQTGSIAQEISINGIAKKSTRQVCGPYPILGTKKQNNFTFVIFNLNSGDQISILGNSPSGATMTVSNSGSFIFISKIA